MPFRGVLRLAVALLPVVALAWVVRFGFAIVTRFGTTVTPSERDVLSRSDASSEGP